MRNICIQRLKNSSLILKLHDLKKILKYKIPPRFVNSPLWSLHFREPSGSYAINLMSISKDQHFTQFSPSYCGSVHSVATVESGVLDVLINPHAAFTVKY